MYLVNSILNNVTNMVAFVYDYCSHPNFSACTMKFTQVYSFLGNVGGY